MKSINTFIFFFFSVYMSLAQVIPESIHIPSKHQQIVLVTTDKWNSQTGFLQLFNKTGSTWTSTGKMIPVSLGKNGLAWGTGLHIGIPSDFLKMEGDGKSPAGIFEFGDAFGYYIKAPLGLKLSYRQSTDRDYWIDMISSPDYNKWVRIPENKENNPKKYWTSFERMKRSDHLYELGLIVKYNMDPIVPSKGSGIFFHIWRNIGSPTLGCTAMSKEDLILLLTWLNPEKNPLLIQVPEEELGKLIYSIK